MLYVKVTVNARFFCQRFWTCVENKENIFNGNTKEIAEFISLLILLKPKRVSAKTFLLSAQRILRIKFDDYSIHLDFFICLFICTSSYTLCLPAFIETIEREREKRDEIKRRKDVSSLVGRSVCVNLRMRITRGFCGFCCVVVGCISTDLEFWVNTRKMMNSGDLISMYCVHFELLVLGRMRSLDKMHYPNFKIFLDRLFRIVLQSFPNKPSKKAHKNSSVFSLCSFHALFASLHG